MGLAAPRKRVKISHDPNNTHWTRSTTSYGRKMLLSQGWTPGTFLGATDARHSYLHTDASSSPVRVALKDDNLGLGAKRGSGHVEGQYTGLDAYQGVLGRLNGKSEVVLEKEQKSRDDVKRAFYMENRWGTLRFVTGGVLVGNRIEELAERERLRLAGRLAVPNPEKESEKQNGGREDRARAEAKAKHRVDLRRDQSETVSAETSSEDSVEISTSEEVGQLITTLVPVGTVGKENDGFNVEVTHKGKKRAEKLQRKVDRMERREARRLRRIIRQAPSKDSTLPPRTETSHLVDLSSTKISSQLESTAPEQAMALPIIAAPPLGGRHAVRQRYIRQKKMAMMGPKALNEILMVKA